MSTNRKIDNIIDLLIYKGKYIYINIIQIYQKLMLRYNQWLLKFVDNQERNTARTDDDGKTEVERLLSSIFYQINSNQGNENGFMSRDKIYLVREAENYKYIFYFKLTGNRKAGYCKQMFNQQC